MKKDCRTPVRLTAWTALCVLGFGLSAFGQRSPVDIRGQIRAADSLRSTAATIQPAFCLTAHTVGRVIFPINNSGRIGSGAEYPQNDCFTGDYLRSVEYPKSERVTYLYKGALWVGGVVGRDTLVSSGGTWRPRSYEFYPDVAPFGNIVRRTTLDPNDPEYDKAVSEDDIIAVYTDTFTAGVPNLAFDPLDSRPHEPLHLRVEQRSYAWSYEYADDIVFLDYTIKNIGDDLIKDVYVGLFLDADCQVDVVNIAPVEMGFIKQVSQDNSDDLTGFLRDWPIEFKDCEFRDTVCLAWAADNDGGGGRYNPFSVASVAAVRPLREIAEGQQLSYNWWVYNYNTRYDFGPQQRDKYRYMGSGTGTPFGDRNIYALMSNGEIDYDQAYTLSIESNDPVWLPLAYNLAQGVMRGQDVSYCLSIGPYRMFPGAEVNIPIAYVLAENFHTYPRNWELNLYHYVQPELYNKNLNFDSLVANARWASWIYDNPGYDTNEDGYRGKFWVCATDSVFQGGQWIPTAADTTYYAGDGVPDYRAAAPPPAPYVTVTPTLGGLKVRFNGERSENTPDIFTGVADFEGYRVYYGRDEREVSYSLVASYDRDNYDKYVVVMHDREDPTAEIVDIPLTLEQLRCLYGEGDDPCNDMDFDPLEYTFSQPYFHPDFPDSMFFFRKHDFNASEFGVTTDIIKVYPDAELPVGQPDSSDLTEDGHLKYYEYEMVIRDLLPTVPYWVNVTAFDFGSPETGLQPLETSKTVDAQTAYPASESSQLAEERPPVYIYPNPYRIDGGYRRDGFEGRTDFDRPNNRVRAVHFENLPPRCTISIFSLDGDLVREIKHDVPESDPTHTHDSWNMITRNTQAPVSGLYYWTVEDDQGNVQIGKLMIIM